MAYEPKEGSGALFKNDKGDNAARPDYRGDLMVGGVLYEVAGWIKPLPNNAEKRFMSLSAKVKEQRQEQPAKRPSHDAAKARQLPQASSGFDDMDSEIPF